jgi:hypothetical protein
MRGGLVTDTSKDHDSDIDLSDGWEDWPDSDLDIDDDAFAEAIARGRALEAAA